MSDLDVLGELINKKALVQLEQNSCGKKTVTLDEFDSQGQTQYSIKIEGIPENTIVVKTDIFPSPGSIFACQKGECKRADYVIITNSATANLIVYVEMKKGKGRKSEIINQLKGSECFISYCRAIVFRFWQQSKFLEQYENRFVTFRNIGIRKSPTRIRPRKSLTRESRSAKLHDEPGKMLRISDVGDGGEIPFRRLIQGSSHR